MGKFFVWEFLFVMQKGHLKILQRQIKVVCKFIRCIIFIIHKRHCKARECVREKTQKPTFLQPQLGQTKKLPIEKQRRRHNKKGNELEQNDIGSGRGDEKFRAMQLHWSKERFLHMEIILLCWFGTLFCCFYFEWNSYK